VVGNILTLQNKRIPHKILISQLK